MDMLCRLSYRGMGKAGGIYHLKAMMSRAQIGSWHDKEDEQSRHDPRPGDRSRSYSGLAWRRKPA